MRGVLLCLCLSLGLVWGLSPTSYLTNGDTQHFKDVLETSWSLKDLQQVFYSVGGYKHLKIQVPNKESVCTFVKNSVKAGHTLETLYFASASAKSLGCMFPAPTTAKKMIADSTREGSSSQEIFYGVMSASYLSIPVDSPKALRAMQQALKKEDSVLSLGYAFHVGSQLKGDVSPIFERIEDAVVQADEIDGTMLQFEGGLSITALVLSGAYRLSEVAKKAVPLTSEQVVKFSNYLMSRKSVQIPKGVFYLLEAVTMLTNNKYHIPVAMTLESNVAVSSDSPKVQVKVTNLLGEDLGALKVTAISGKQTSTGSMIFENKQLKSVANKKSVFELDMMSLRPARGFYKLTLTAEGGDARMVGHQKAVLKIKVLTSVELVDIEFGVADSDQSTAPILKRLTYPSKLKTVLEADQHQKLLLKFLIKDTSSREVSRVHQAFIKVTHLETQREIIFVAEPDMTNAYKFDMSVRARKKDFGGVSGKYSIEMIVGDPAISNPMVWHVADVSLTFPDGTVSETSQDFTYKARPEIHHTFRSPDPRPPTIVSLAFTGLCLFPLLILIVGWLRLGVNVSNFTFSLCGLGFHLGLGGIFGLFCMFWLRLNMFSTLKYLVLVGLFTFTSGNLMLSRIAARRKKSLQ